MLKTPTYYDLPSTTRDLPKDQLSELQQRLEFFLSVPTLVDWEIWKKFVLYDDITWGQAVTALYVPIPQLPTRDQLLLAFNYATH